MRYAIYHVGYSLNQEKAYAEDEEYEQKIASGEWFNSIKEADEVFNKIKPKVEAEIASSAKKRARKCQTQK